MSDSIILDREIVAMLDAIVPQEIAQQHVANRQVVNKSGKINRPAVTPFLPLLVARWAPSDTAGWYVPQPSTVVRLAAHAATPPSSGDATVRLRVIAPGAGIATIGTATIANGAATGAAEFSDDIAAGSWLFADVTVTNGASGVSIAATLRVR